MTDAPQAPTMPDAGPLEAEMAARLADGWLPISIEQRGPDGTEVLALLLFSACPVCSAVVPPSDLGHPFVREHAAHHIEQARLLDSLREGSDG